MSKTFAMVGKTGELPSRAELAELEALTKSLMRHALDCGNSVRALRALRAAWLSLSVHVLPDGDTERTLYELVPMVRSMEDELQGRAPIGGTA